MSPGALSLALNGIALVEFWGWDWHFRLSTRFAFISHSPWGLHPTCWNTWAEAVPGDSPPGLQCWDGVWQVLGSGLQGMFWVPALFQRSLCSGSHCSAGGCSLHDAKGNRDFFVVRGRLPCRQKLNPNQQFPSLSLPKPGYHFACVLGHEFSGAVLVWWFGLVILVVKEKPVTSSQ